MYLLGHHTKSYLGIEIEVNGKTFPDGTFDHVMALVGLLVMVYGVFAIVRDLIRWRRRAQIRATGRST